MPIWKRLFLAATVAGALTPSASAEGLSPCESFAEAAFAAWQSGKAIDKADLALIADEADAACAQDRLIALMKADGKAIVGYKLAATSEAAQQALQAKAPIPGVLFSGMLRPNGATLDLAKTNAPLFEADLLVRIADPKIREATTVAEALAGLDAVVPFIEVPDSLLPQGTAMSGLFLQAMNAAPRWGVTGDPIPLVQAPETIEQLAAMRAVLRNARGEVLTDAAGSALLGQPLEAVLLLMAAAREKDWPVEAAMLLSLGTLGRFHPAKAGERVELIYQGLGGATPVSLSFE